MEKITQKDIDWLLNLNKGDSQDSAKSTAASGFKTYFLRTITWILLIIALVALPFFLLVRMSVFLNVTHQWHGWASILGGVITTVFLLLVYLLLLFRRVENKKALIRLGSAGAGIMVLGFCFYGLIYLSGVNAKNQEIREVYRSLHPVLRVAITTMTLADGELVITDISRTPASYRKMGLKVNQQSLHYTQDDGFVHAVDLRTRDRGEVRNFFMRSGLELMGFNTLRHAGTGDHLHVSLPEGE